MALLIRECGNLVLCSDPGEALRRLMGERGIEWMTIEVRPIPQGVRPWLDHARDMQVELVDLAGEEKIWYEEVSMWDEITQAVFDGDGIKKHLPENARFDRLRGPVLIYRIFCNRYNGAQVKIPPCGSLVEYRRLLFCRCVALNMIGIAIRHGVTETTHVLS